MKKGLLLFLFLFVAVGVSLAGVHSDEVPIHNLEWWAVIPFVVLLLMIATGPLFYEHFWHSNYPLISVILSVGVVAYYLLWLGDTTHPLHALAEYVQFISLLASLYIASGGIMIEIDKEATPRANVILLLVGAILSNFIGTTGASMLLIRPFIRLNQSRIKSYHVIFFIFIVSNIGGSLTPIGDPPLFLGFLKGVPFIWTTIVNFMPWLTALSLLLITFYIIDINNKTKYEFIEERKAPTGKVTITGKRNFLWLLVIIIAVFFDPNVIEGVPYIPFHGEKVSFLRETIMLSVAFLSYRYAKKDAIKGNDFSFEPIREVAFLFIGIFGTMMPALEMVGNFAASPQGQALINPNTLYWGTGMLSGFLDNAPTYINFLTAAMASQDLDINTIDEVIYFAWDRSALLRAISIGAVFFGAFTYIGNGPNFMVKSIAEEIGLKMPSFFGYILRYSLIFLLPLYIIIWLIFFR